MLGVVQARMEGMLMAAPALLPLSWVLFPSKTALGGFVRCSRVPGLSLRVSTLPFRIQRGVCWKKSAKPALK